MLTGLNLGDNIKNKMTQILIITMEIFCSFPNISFLYTYDYLFPNWSSDSVIDNLLFYWHSVTWIDHILFFHCRTFYFFQAFQLLFPILKSLLENSSRTVAFHIPLTRHRNLSARKSHNKFWITGLMRNEVVSDKRFCIISMYNSNSHWVHMSFCIKLICIWLFP